MGGREKGDSLKPTILWFVILISGIALGTPASATQHLILCANHSCECVYDVNAACVAVGNFCDFHGRCTLRRVGIARENSDY